MITFICAHCGRFATYQLDSIDSGTVLVCSECGQKTIVDLDTPEQRARRYGHSSTTRYTDSQSQTPTVDNQRKE